MVKEIKGDLIELGKAGEFDFIIHGCNCQKKMGSGIALQIRNEFPHAYHLDLNWNIEPEKKLGQIITAHDAKDRVNIINAYTQLRPAYYAGEHVFDYDALKSCLFNIIQQYSGNRFGICQIGAGLAGGNWNKIRSIIKEYMKDEDCTIVYYY
jgi:O-acetyl-ADP-ribose deacetylase (regulator of RNase III)